MKSEAPIVPRQSFHAAKGRCILKHRSIDLATNHSPERFAKEMPHRAGSISPALIARQIDAAGLQHPYGMSATSKVMPRACRMPGPREASRTAQRPSTRCSQTLWSSKRPGQR